MSMNKCKLCDHKINNPDGGHCYMFRVEPPFRCHAFVEAKANHAHEPQPDLYVKDINGNFHPYREKGHTENCMPLAEPVAVARMAIETLRLGIKHQPLEKIDAFKQAIRDLEVFSEKYTTPQQRKPLTDEQWFEIWQVSTDLDNVEVTMSLNDFKIAARVAEAAHGIKEQL